MKILMNDVERKLLQREGGRGSAVGVFQLLQEHLAVSLLDCLVHFRFAHDLAHQILDGRFRVEFEQLRHAGVVIFKRLWLRWRCCQFIRSLSSASSERVAERSLGFCVNLVAAESSRVLGSGKNYNLHRKLLSNTRPTRSAITPQFTSSTTTLKHTISATITLPVTFAIPE